MAIRMNAGITTTHTIDNTPVSLTVVDATTVEGLIDGMTIYLNMWPMPGGGYQIEVIDDCGAVFGERIISGKTWRSVAWGVMDVICLS